MKKEAAKFFAVLIMLFCFVLPAHAGDFKNVVVFGDSLSDSGNIFSTSQGIYPPSSYDGRYSNGPVWVEYLVKSLGISGDFSNYAFAGANTGTTNPAELNAPGLLTQIPAYATLLTASAFFPTAVPQPKDTLFIIWIGSNDLLDLGSNDPAAAISDSIDNIKTGMTQLINLGAVKFMSVNLPDIGLTPRLNKDATAAAGGTQLVSLFNSSLETMLEGLEAAYPSIEIARFDVFSLLQEVSADPGSWGFTNVTDSKFDKNTNTVAQGNYLFWDDIHPTTMTHKIIAKQAAAVLLGKFNYMGQPSFDSALKFTIPYAEFGNADYGFQLDYYNNPADPNGYYWKLDTSSLIEVQ